MSNQPHIKKKGQGGGRNHSVLLSHVLHELPWINFCEKYMHLEDICVCDWLWLIYYWSIANYKVLELKLVCSCLYFNINTNACMRNNKSYIRPIYNCHRLFLLVNVNEMILLVACSYLHVELCSFIIVVDLGGKSNKAEVFFFRS